MSGLDWSGAIDDVKACATWLKANGCSKVVVIGFCMGGALSLGSAVQLSEVDACIAFYGWNKQLGDVSTVCIQTPSEILLVFCVPTLFSLARVCCLRETRDEHICGRTRSQRLPETAPIQSKTTCQMSKPVQCHFGDQDDIAGFSDLAASTELEALLQQSGCPLEFYRYPTQVNHYLLHEAVHIQIAPFIRLFSASSASEFTLSFDLAPVPSTIIVRH